MTQRSKRAEQLLARSRGRAFRPPPVPGLAEAPRLRAQHAKAFDAVVAKRPLDPPGRKLKP